MAKRYSRILSAAKYYGAIDNYLKWVTDATKHNPNVGGGRARAASIPLFVVPFNIDLAAGQKARVSAAEPSWNTYGAKFGTRTSAAAPADPGNIIKLADYKPARAVITIGRSASGSVKTSHVTGVKYLGYGGRSTSIPFGQTGDADDELTAFNAIKAALLPSLSANDKVTLQPEKF